MEFRTSRLTEARLQRRLFPPEQRRVAAGERELARGIFLVKSRRLVATPPTGDWVNRPYSGKQKDSPAVRPYLANLECG